MRGGKKKKKKERAGPPKRNRSAGPAGFRRDAPSPEADRGDSSPPAEGGGAEGGLAGALRLAGLGPGDLLTHYDFGGGRVVLVPKEGERIAVDLKTGAGKEEKG